MICCLVAKKYLCILIYVTCIFNKIMKEADMLKVNKITSTPICKIKPAEAAQKATKASSKEHLLLKSLLALSIMSAPLVQSCKTLMKL